MTPLDFDCSAKTLLLVDDEPANLQVLAGFLEQPGFELTMALNGSSGLDKARREHPDLILLDIMMPRMDGYETCERLKADPLTRNIPVIFLSALQDIQDKMKAFAAGAADFVTKPFQEAELLARVGVHLGLGHLQGRLLENNQLLQAKNRELEESIQRYQTAQRALSESEARNRLLLDSTQEGIFGLDLEGRCTFCNTAAAQLLGYQDPVQLIGKDIHALSHYRHSDGSPYPEDECLIRASYVTGKPTHSPDDVFWRLDGRALPVEFRSSPIRRDGKLVGAVVSFLDISERQRAEQQLRLGATVLDASDEAVMFCDFQHRVIAVNPAFVKITGFDEAEVLGRIPKEVLTSDRHDRDFYDSIWDSVKRTGSWRGEIWNRRKSGEIYPCWINVSEVRDAQRRLTHYVSVFSDISAIKQSHERMEHLAHHDLLTGLPNRLLLQDRLRQAIEKAKRRRSGFALLFLDLDRFKQVNDSLGHAMGDRLLRAVAERLRPLLRASDTVARMGGDEFVLILEDTVLPEHAGRIAAKVIDEINHPVRLDGYDLHVGASVGIALYPKDGRDADELLRLADMAMYAAKQEGRNVCRFYTSTLGAAIDQRSRIEAQLEQALTRGELLLHFQPQYTLGDGSLAGAEALLRWQPAQGEPMLPGDFLPLLENADLIRRIGHWVLREACRRAVEWRRAGLGLPRIAVNLSAEQLRGDDLAETVRKVLEETGLEPDRLELEVTEAVVRDRREDSLATMHTLRSMGVKLVVDGFGSGFRSLRELRGISVDKLKLDRSFVCDLPRNLNDQALAEALLALGRSLQLQTAGNGVEQEEQKRFLGDHGCNVAQGYLFSPPLSEEAFRRLLVDKTNGA